MSRAEGKALLLFAHGEGHAILYQADEPVEQWLADVDAMEPFHCGFRLDPCDAPKLADGLWLASLRLGYWPGSREYVLEVYDESPASLDAWRAYCKGEYPWDWEPKPAPAVIVEEEGP